MGFIWDLIQHGTLVKLLRGLETRFGQDLDGDNRVG